MPTSPNRIQSLNDHAVTPGDYLLYWLQQSQRTEHNPALEFAIGEANRLKTPLIVGFGLTADYPEANLRHFRFMLEGLQEVDEALHRKEIKLVLRIADPPDVAIELGRSASMIVCDVGYTRHQRRWRNSVAIEAPCRSDPYSEKSGTWRPAAWSANAISRPMLKRLAARSEMLNCLCSNEKTLSEISLPVLSFFGKSFLPVLY